MNYLVLDTESSGTLNPNVRVVQLGFCNVINDEIRDNSQINIFPPPQLEMSKKAVEIHGLTENILRDTGADSGEVFKSLRDNLQRISDSGTWIVGHNIIGFDRKIINIEFNNHGLGSFDFENSKILDTGMLYKAFHMWWKRAAGERIWDFMNRVFCYRSSVKWNLRHCCEYFGIDFSDNEAHGARYDCLKTHEILQAMIGNKFLLDILGDINE